MDQNTFCWWNHFSASAGSRKEGWIALSPSTFALRAGAEQVALGKDGKNGTRHRILAEASEECLIVSPRENRGRRESRVSKAPAAARGV
jgi:hypothetical protein